MEIKIIFEIEKNSRETLNKFSGALEKISDGNLIPEAILKHVNDDAINPKNQEEMYAGPAKKEVPTPVAETPTETETSTVEETKVEHEPGATDVLPVSDGVPKATTPAYTNEQLVEFCSQASQLGLGSKVKDLIRNEFGVQKVSDLAENIREDFVNKLRGLGVRI